jgi:hypothetical protein
MNDLEPLLILQINDETEFPRMPGLLGAIQGAPLPSSSVVSDPQRSSCRGRRRPKPGNEHQDIPEHQPRYRDLGHLECNVAAVADDLGTDLDQLLPQTGQRPRLRRLGHRECPHEIAKVVGQRVELKTHGVSGEGMA